MQRTLGAAGSACGVLGPLLWAAAIAWSATQVPDYSHLNRLIGELAASGSPSELFMRYVGYGLSGGLHVAFALFLGLVFRHDRLALAGAILLALGGLARIAAGLHPCDPGCNPVRPSSDQEAHELASTLGFIALLVAAILWGTSLQRYGRLKGYGTLAFACAAWALVSQILLIVYPGVQGLLQRLASGLLSLWVMALAIGVWRTAAYAMLPAAEAPLPAPKERSR